MPSRVVPTGGAVMRSSEIPGVVEAQHDDVVGALLDAQHGGKGHGGVIGPTRPRNDRCRVGQPLHAVRDHLTAALDQAVGVHDERVASVEHDLVPGPGRAAQPGRDQERALHGAERRAAVGAHHQRRWVTGVAQDDPPGRGCDRPDDRGDHPVLDERVEEAVQRRQHLGRRQAGDGVGADGAAHLAHQRRRRSALAHHVAHAEEDRVVVELEDVVPVAAGVGAGHPGPVLGIEQEALDFGERVGQDGALRARPPRRAPAGTAWRWTGRPRPGSPPRWPARRRPPRRAVRARPRRSSRR